jgi:hypothetical protein
MSRNHLGHTAYHHVGADDVAVVQVAPQNSALIRAQALLLVGAQGLCVYHGYKRSRGSISWAVSWGILAFLAPVITTSVAVAQGFGRPKGQ